MTAKVRKNTLDFGEFNENGSKVNKANRSLLSRIHKNLSIFLVNFFLQIVTSSCNMKITVL